MGNLVLLQWRAKGLHLMELRGLLVHHLVLLQHLLVSAEPPSELLSVPRLVVLEPIEDILPLYFPIVGKMSRNLLYLRGVGSPYSTPIHLLQYHELLRRWAPSR